MDNEYKKKYLKYKIKYLELMKTNLIGGVAECPQVGFHQHINECVHDSLLMILLYSDDFSERIQRLFDSLKFDIKDCKSIASMHFNKFFIPIQIEKTNESEFDKESMSYITNIYERYINEKKEFVEKGLIASLSSRAERVWPVYAAPTKQITRTLPRLQRRDSINESLSCNFSLFKLTNINILKDFTFKYTHNKHGATYLHNLTAISMINYYLTNYRPPSIFGATSTSGTEKKQFLSMRSYDLFEIFMINELQYIDTPDLHKILDEIKDRLHELYSLINYSKNLLGISLSLGIKEDFEASGHEVAFMKCNNVEKFYDNNGVYDIKIDEDFDTTEGPDVPDLVKYPDYYMKKGSDLIKDFRWKDYLSDVIIKCKNELQLLKKIKDREEIIRKINELLNSFSALFTSNDNIKKYLKDGKDDKCGREYLKDYMIRQMKLFFINNISNERIKEEEFILANIQNILEVYTVYTNDRTYDLLRQALLLSPDSFKSVFARLAQNQNYIFIEKLIKDFKFPIIIKIECVALILNNILEQPRDENSYNLVKTLMSIKEIHMLSNDKDNLRKILEFMRQYRYYSSYSDLLKIDF
jgi:hypothetical protein